MEPTDIRWIMRFDNYKNALQTIEDILPRYKEVSELEKDRLIQRFEFTFDLAWKVMQDYLKFSGYAAIKGPRASIKQMSQDNLLDAFAWGEILNTRNELAHIYDEDKSRSHLDTIIYDYVPVLQSFKVQMEQKL